MKVRTLSIVSLALLVTWRQSASAFPGGATGYSGSGGKTCTQCHGGGAVPTAALTGLGSVAPGATNTYVLTIGGGQKKYGALDVSASAGALIAFESGTKLSNGEITHTTRKAVDGSGNVSFSFKWTAPSSAGTVTMYAAGLSANGDGGTGSDGTKATTLSVKVESAPPQNQPPVAKPGGPYSGTVGVAVAMDGSGSSDPDGTIASYDWDFGDGATGTGAKPSHTYASAATFTVKLTVTDDKGAKNSKSTTADITEAGQQPPVAEAGGPYKGSKGKLIQFNGSLSHDPDGTIASYDWDFGDGSTGTGAKPMHTYANAGPYEATLSVTDNDGLKGSGKASVTVDDGSSQGPVRVVAPAKLTVRQASTKATNVAVHVYIDGSGLPPGTETCGTVHLLKDGDEVDTQSVCIKTKAPHTAGEEEAEGEDGDEELASTMDSSSARIFHRVARFRSNVLPDDAPSVEWSAFVEIGGVASDSGTMPTQVFVKIPKS